MTEEFAAAIRAEAERCRPFLEPAMAMNGGTHDWASILDGLLALRLQLWPAPDAAVVTELVRTPSGQLVCNAFLGGGRLASLLRIAPQVEAWAGANGADALTIHGRPGWGRIFKGTGARCVTHVIRKELP